MISRGRPSAMMQGSNRYAQRLVCSGPLKAASLPAGRAKIPRSLFGLLIVTLQQGLAFEAASEGERHGPYSLHREPCRRSEGAARRDAPSGAEKANPCCGSLAFLKSG